MKTLTIYIIFTTLAVIASIIWVHLLYKYRKDRSEGLVPIALATALVSLLWAINGGIAETLANLLKLQP